MTYPQQPWQPQGQPPGQYPNMPGPGQNPGWPQYGAVPAQPRLNFAALDQTKVSASAVVAAAAIVLLGSLFSLYSVTVTPSGAAVRGNDAPAGTVEVGIGFFDVVPFPAPIIATAIPLLMVLAALTAAPAILAGAQKISGLPAVFAGTSALLSIVLAISNPLPTVELSGEMATNLSDKIGGQTLDQLIDSVVAVSPGAGLVTAALFGVIGWAAAVLPLFRRTAVGQTPPPAPGVPPNNPYVPPTPNAPPPW